MAGDYSSGGGTAAEELGAAAGAEPDPTEEQEPPTPESSEDGIYIDAFPGSENLKPGDPLPLRMVGQTPDGQIQCEPMPMGDGEPAWKKDLKNSVQTVPGGAGIGNGPEM